ncbi:hypothetical protein BN8_03054 [Fibrisoma limi BUZ 3]|uniref:Uncharacterized protein n=1 Tax=Fibrisoma limi BUZ 3 TaxID=1185876 RepID=I2GJ45_9BACT|nr:hypothetical protein [Fibrisoma limi]CCH53920.1 hypothetical protein BN8_03054 [Fibrisoma limi BUZ 3]
MQPNLAYLATELPNWLAAGFVFIVLFTVVLLFTAIWQTSLPTAWYALTGMLGWLLLTGGLAYRGVFLETSATPPRFVLLVLPPLGLIVTLFSFSRTRQWLDRLPLTTLTYLHSNRLAVELLLYGLFTYRQIPDLMTFEGRNFDILVGLTAPLVGYLAFHRHSMTNRALLVWNLFGLVLLLNIVINAVLSGPSPFQQFAFDQPNVGVLRFPFVWLPGFVVPVALFSHLVAIRQLLFRTKQTAHYQPAIRHSS